MKQISGKLIVEIQRLFIEHFEALDTDYPDYRVVKAKERAIWYRLSKIANDKKERDEILEAIAHGTWRTDDRTFKPICDDLRELGYEIVWECDNDIKD